MTLTIRMTTHQQIGKPKKEERWAELVKTFKFPMSTHRTIGPSKPKTPVPEFHTLSARISANDFLIDCLFNLCILLLLWFSGSWLIHSANALFPTTLSVSCSLGQTAITCFLRDRLRSPFVVQHNQPLRVRQTWVSLHELLFLEHCVPCV